MNFVEQPVNIRNDNAISRILFIMVPLWRDAVEGFLLFPSPTRIFEDSLQRGSGILEFMIPVTHLRVVYFRFRTAARPISSGTD